jgi:pimeloyl-ACP methyl ester carboxylesterase
MKWAHDGLRAGGVRAEIRVFDWQRGPAFLYNLTDHEGNLYRAAAVAHEMAAFAREHPAAPIDVVGYSGGGGLALLIAEALPPGVKLRNVVLVQAAISPDYDLTQVLARVDNKLVNFHCPSDWLILGLGTQVFGTIDRSYTESAGKGGFNLGRAVPDVRSRQQVEQVCWTADMLWAGHPGNHTGILLRDWNRRYVAPYLVSAERGR